MAVKKKTEKKIVKQKEPALTKEQILSIEKYSNRKDLLNVLLAEAKTYTLNDVNALLEDFMKRKVK